MKRQLTGRWLALNLLTVWNLLLAFLVAKGDLGLLLVFASVAVVQRLTVGRWVADSYKWLATFGDSARLATLLQIRSDERGDVQTPPSEQCVEDRSVAANDKNAFGHP